jgi:hypothetical protein
MSDAVDLHEAELMKRAIVLAREQPDLRFVAFVAEAGTPEAAMLGVAQKDVLRGADGSVAAFVTRESAKKMLGEITPQLLEWLEDEGDGKRRRLPVIHAGPKGMRAGSILYDLPG